MENNITKLEQENLILKQQLKAMEQERRKRLKCLYFDYDYPESFNGLEKKMKKYNVVEFMFFDSNLICYVEMKSKK